MIDNLIHWSINVVAHYGLFGVFGIMVVENLGIPFPTEAGFIVVQQLINSYRINFWIAFLIINLGQLTGALIAYSIGRWGNKMLIKKLDRANRIEETHQKLIRWYHKYGSVTVFATRLIGYIRPWSSFVAGLADLPFVPFIIWTILGTAIFTLINMIFTHWLLFYWARYQQYHVLIGVGLLVCFFGFLIYELIKYIFKKKD